MKNLNGHDIVCVPFLESASNTEKNDTKHDTEFRILATSGKGWTMQSLNFASDIEVWCTVRPYSQTAESCRVALQRDWLVQITNFCSQMVEFAQIHQIRC